jgi:hypothetical protein
MRWRLIAIAVKSATLGGGVTSTRRLSVLLPNDDPARAVATIV